MPHRTAKEHQRLVDILKRHEGLRLHPYEDSVGVSTIGYGRNLEDVGISKDEAALLLANDIARAQKEAEVNIPHFECLDIVRQDVLINMIFNLGIKGFMRFRRLRLAIDCQDWSWACHEMLDSKWARQVGSRAIELAEMMRYGRYPNESE